MYPIDLLTLIIGGLATYRVSRMLSTEEGFGVPYGKIEDRDYGIFLRIREHIDLDQKTWLGRGVRCSLCLSFWIAIPIALLLMFTWWGVYLLLPLALSGINTILYTSERKH